MQAVIDGKTIASEQDFHCRLAEAMDFGEHYGHNLDALWDELTGNVERPVTLVWKHAAASKAAMPEHFAAIVGLLEQVAQQDRDHGWDERFKLQLD